MKVKITDHGESIKLKLENERVLGDTYADMISRHHFSVFVETCQNVLVGKVQSAELNLEE